MALNNWQKNATAAVGRKVVNAESTDLCIGVDEMRQKPTSLDDYSVPACCEPQVNAHNSNVHVPLPVLYCPVVSSVPINTEQGDSDRTEGIQFEVDMPAERVTEDSCQHVSYEVIIC